MSSHSHEYGRRRSTRSVATLISVTQLQEFYGTCLYYFQYFYNHRNKRSTSLMVWGVVVPANLIWIVFPALAIWVSVTLILDGDFAVLR